MDNKNPVGKRKELVDEFGYDVKFAYHLVRLLLEVEQILTEETLNLERDREQLKAIRRGQWTEGEIRAFFALKESALESFYTESKLPWSADEAAIKNLLVECLEMHYGSLPIPQPDRYEKAIQQVQEILGGLR